MESEIFDDCVLIELSYLEQHRKSNVFKIFDENTRLCEVNYCVKSYFKQSQSIFRNYFGLIKLLNKILDYSY